VADGVVVKVVEIVVEIAPWQPDISTNASKLNVNVKTLVHFRFILSVSIFHNPLYARVISFLTGANCQTKTKTMSINLIILAAIINLP
jgi:hypothetical protein